MNELHYGDNLAIVRALPDESVDLVYLDPPYPLTGSRAEASYSLGAQLASEGRQTSDLVDGWRWNPTTDRLYADLISGSAPTGTRNVLETFHHLLGRSDELAYLVEIAIRLPDLRRVLKGTGSLYFQCDPAVSHYTRLLLDAVFGRRNFRSQVIWKRSNRHDGQRHFVPSHDVILFYTKSDQYTWHRVVEPPDEKAILKTYAAIEAETGRRFARVSLTGPGARGGASGEPWRGVNPSAQGRHWAIPSFVRGEVEGLSTLDALDALLASGRIEFRSEGGLPTLKRYAEEAVGRPLGDVLSDISGVGAEGFEYATQKPVALLERLLAAASNPGDRVLDPFCGGGTTLEVAERLGRRWVGIDVSFIAIDLTMKRLIRAFGEGVMDRVELGGVPTDGIGAKELFDSDPLNFERWAVSKLGAQPIGHQAGDRGIDGVAVFTRDGTLKNLGRILVSVKAGQRVSQSAIDDLLANLSSHEAELAVFVTQSAATPQMLAAIDAAGTFVHPASGQEFPRLQHVTAADLAAGLRPRLPVTLMTYASSAKSRPDAT